MNVAIVWSLTLCYNDTLHASYKPLPKFSLLYSLTYKKSNMCDTDKSSVINMDTVKEQSITPIISRFTLLWSIHCLFQDLLSCGLYIASYNQNSYKNSKSYGRSDVKSVFHTMSVGHIPK